MRSRGLGPRAGARRLGQRGDHRCRRRRTASQRTGQRATAMPSVHAAVLGRHLAVARSRPTGARRRFRARGPAAGHCSSRARAHRTAKPLRSELETIKTVLSRYSDTVTHFATAIFIPPYAKPPKWLGAIRPSEIESKRQHMHCQASLESSGPKTNRNLQIGRIWQARPPRTPSRRPYAAAKQSE